jgi:hypothetical protein
MFIVWGRKARREKMGYVADLCPACSEPRAFLLQRVSMVSHVYYIPLGSGPTVGFERVCLHCKSRYRADPQLYAAIRPSNFAFDELREYTFPNLDAYYAGHLRLQQKLRETPELLSADERTVLITQRIGGMAASVEQRFARTHVDGWVGLALLATIAAMIGAGYLAGMFPDYGSTILGCTLCVGLAGVIVLGATSGRRYIKRKIVPRLVESLRPLQPSAAEIADVLAGFKRRGMKIGRKLKSSDLAGATGAAKADESVALSV